MRLFIAILFDKEILDAFTDFQQELQALGVSGNYTKRENLHITLAFIGEYNDPEAVLEAMERSAFRPMEIALDGVGSFGEIFWAGLKENPALAAYAKRLRRELAESDIPFDRKRFSPHITLVRKAAMRGGGLIPVEEAPQGHMRAARVSLMSSERGKNGMIYTEIASVG